MEKNGKGVRQPSVPYLIRIGVTGHRALQGEEILKEKVRHILKEDIFDLLDKDSEKIIGSCPDTSFVYRIMTSLAEGADRLVAEEVLKFPGALIEAVLPLTQEDYLEDFKTEESRSEFEEFLGKAEKLIILREGSLKERYSGNDLDKARRQAYQDAGRYIVDKCDVVIALWNGEDARGKGGTAEIVEYAEKKQRPIITVSTKPPYNISVRKRKGLEAICLEYEN